MVLATGDQRASWVFRPDDRQTAGVRVA